MSQSLEKGAVVRVEPWLAKGFDHYVQIEPGKQATKSDAAVKAEWERRTKNIRRFKSDMTFRNSPYATQSELVSSTANDGVASYRCIFINAAGEIEPHEFTCETDVDAVAASRRMTADRCQHETFELWRGSHRIYSQPKRTSQTPGPEVTEKAEFPTSLWLGKVALTVLAILGIGTYALWQQLSSFDGQVRADSNTTVFPGLVAPSSEAGTSPPLATTETTDPIQVLSTVSPPATAESLTGPRPASAVSGAIDKSSQGVPSAAASGITTTEPSIKGVSARLTSDLGIASDPSHMFGASAQTGFRIVLRATGETWLEVKDGEVSIFRRLMQAGDEYRLPEKPGLIMRIGNTRAIEVLVDGKPLPIAAQPSQGRRTVVNLDAQELLARAEKQ